MAAPRWGGRPRQVGERAFASGRTVEQKCTVYPNRWIFPLYSVFAGFGGASRLLNVSIDLQKKKIKVLSAVLGL